MGLASFNRQRREQAVKVKAEKQDKPVEPKEEKEPQVTAKKKKAAK